MNPEKSLQEQRKEALLRRADKLLLSLTRPEYAEYKDDNSVSRFIKHINLIEWALENSIPLEDWRPFRTSLYEARNNTLVSKDEEQEKENYYASLKMVGITLLHYKEFIASQLQ